MTDSMIIDLFFARDEQALSECDKKYGQSLRRFAFRLTSDVECSEECVDDTYVKSWESIPPSEPRNYLFAFLSKILRQRCLDRLRHSAREKRASSLTVISDEICNSTPAESYADSDAIRGELAEIIRKFVESLKEETREIFILRYFYMEEVLSISKKLRISEGKVKSVLKRTRDKLKTHLEKYGYTV